MRKCTTPFWKSLKTRTEKIAVGKRKENPANYMGPVISAGAKKSIEQYIEIGKGEGRTITGGNPAPRDGHFLPPTIIADVDPAGAHLSAKGRNLRTGSGSHEGPRFPEHALAIANDSQYGLTGAIYSNDAAHIARARDEFFVGNMYINRKCTGAMVGAHPFGGFNMSGTDSKAGGPDYLLLFLQAKSIAETI